MKTIPKEQVLKRIRAENVWWGEPRIIAAYRNLRPRAYLTLLQPLITNLAVQRAVLLMGPRRVGKTVLLHHAIQRLLESGVNPRNVCYLSVDHPIFNNCTLTDLVELYREAVDLDSTATAYVFFDEIQYMKEWEVHLKTLVDSERSIRFIASGSAAAALKLKSHESGAGRFTDFMLPPLTFYEFVDLLDLSELIGPEEKSNETSAFFSSSDIQTLNREFVRYVNFGGYPEVIFSETIQEDPARFIKSDIIDKVLLRDLPSLYGIENVQELNYLFTSLAYNTANEVSLEGLSRSSGVAKNTIKRYLEYLEAAFLIKEVHRIDRSSKTFQRANFFKVYLTNPSMRAALFAPISPDDDTMGDLAETAIYSQWFHSESSGSDLFYARWNSGEVDIVWLEPEKMKPEWAVEVKWSDRFFDQPGDLKALLDFCAHNQLERVMVTSRTTTGLRTVGQVQLEFLPASLYCYTLGYNIIRSKDRKRRPAQGLARTP